MYLNNKKEKISQKELIHSCLNSTEIINIFKEEEKNKEKENINDKNLIKVNIKMWKNNSSRLNDEIFSNNGFSKYRDKIFDSNTMKSLVESSIERSNRKKYNLKNNKYDISTKQNKFFLTQKIDFFIKKLKKILYRKTFVLIKQKYYSQNSEFKKGKNSFKSCNKIQERKTNSFKKKINNKEKDKINNIKRNKMKNINPLFLYNNLGLNILGTQPSKESKIKKNDSSVKKRKNKGNNLIPNSDKKCLVKNKNNQKKVFSKNSNDKNVKKNYNFEKNVLPKKNINKEFTSKTNNKKKPNIDKSNLIQNEHKEGIKYYNTEICNEIINNNYSKYKIEQIEKMFLKKNFERNKKLKMKKNLNNIINQDDKNNEKIECVKNDDVFSINNIKYIKNSFFYWRSSIVKQKILNSLIYISKFDKFIKKIQTIFIDKFMKIMNNCILFKYFQIYKDKYFRWKIMKNLKKIKNKIISNKEVNKIDIINNININNYIYSDYNKFINQKNKNPIFVSKLICSKNKKENLLKEIKELGKDINIFAEKNQDINSVQQNFNNYNNYIFLNQTDRSYNKINRNLFFENYSKDGIMFVKSINNRNNKSNIFSENITNQTNQLRMVINLIEKHRRKKMNLYEKFHKWVLITKLNIRKNSPELYKSFYINNKDIYDKYSMNKYNKKITNVAFSSKKSEKKKEDSDNYASVKEIKNFRSITTGKIPYYNYCNSSNMINNKVNMNKNNININSFKLIETNNNNINNNYIYHKKRVNISNISGINNCFLENNNIINKNISMNLTNTSFYCNRMIELNKNKAIEEKKVSLKKLNRIEEMEINFALYKIKNLKESDETINKNIQKSKNEIFINNDIYNFDCVKINKNNNYNESNKEIKKNNKSSLFENRCLNRSKSSNFTKRKALLEFNNSNKISNSSFSFFRNKMII